MTFQTSRRYPLRLPTALFTTRVKAVAQSNEFMCTSVFIQILYRILYAQFRNLLWVIRSTKKHISGHSRESLRSPLLKGRLRTQFEKEQSSCAAARESLA